MPMLHETNSIIYYRNDYIATNIAIQNGKQQQ